MGEKLKLLLVFSIFLLLISSNTCFATPPALPYFCIIIEGGSSDNLTISYKYEKAGTQPFVPYKKLWETCYVGVFPFQYLDVGEITVSKGAESFNIGFSTIEIQDNDNTMTLNIKNQTLTPGKSINRSVLIISIRMLAITGLQILVFLLFRFKAKTKRNIISFLVINFLCWLIINIYMNQLSIYSSNQAMFWINMRLVFASAVSGILIVIIIPVFIKEKGLSRKIILGLASHYIAFFAMKIMIEHLPF